MYSHDSLKKLREESGSQEGKVKCDFRKWKKWKRELTLSTIKKRKERNITGVILNEMVKCGGTTMAHWHVEINLEIELRTKETLLSTWSKLVLSKQKITSCIKSLPSVPICVWSHNNNNFLVFCDACKYSYNRTCMLVNANFNSSFLFDCFCLLMLYIS